MHVCPHSWCVGLNSGIVGIIVEDRHCRSETIKTPAALSQHQPNSVIAEGTVMINSCF